MTKDVVGARAQLLAAAALFSTGGAVVKAISLSAWPVASFRSLVAAAALLLLVPSARRLGNPRVFVVGLFFAITMICFVVANKLTTAANSIYLQGTAPLHMVWLAPLLLKERPRRRDLGFMLVLALGMALFFVGSEAPQETAPDPLRGNVVGALAGLFWACTVCGLRWLGRDRAEGGSDSGLAAVAAGSLLAGFLALPLALGDASVTWPLATKDTLLVLYLGLIQIVLAYVFLTRGLTRVPALTASLILLLEPVLSPFFAWWFHGEAPTGLALVGCGVILLATFVMAWIDGRRAAA